MLELGEGVYWLAMVRNGQPTNTDEVLSESDDAQAMARVRQLVAQFEGEVITVFTDIANSGFDNLKFFTLHDLFEIVRTNDDRLVRVAKTNQALPKPVLIVAGVGIGLLAVQRGYMEWKSYQVAKANASAIVVEEAPEVAWSRVVRAFLGATPKPNPQLFLAIRKSLSDVPVVWSGWTLSGARCQASAQLNEKSERPWTCQASYERGRVALTSREIREQVMTRNPAWSVGFASVNTMQLSWALQQQEKAIELADLVEPTANALRNMSVLQEFFPVLAGKPEFKFVPLGLPVPKRTDGQPHPKPATVPNIVRAELTLKGPLRSMDAIAAELKSVQWDSMGLVADAKADPGQKGAAGSSLMAELNGKVYGKTP